MDIKDVIEWFLIADEDFDSAKILNEASHKHREIICYHCAQSVEKYLKGYLTFNDSIPMKTHNIILLNENCIEIDRVFEQIRYECGFLNKFSNEIRYPYRQVYHVGREYTWRMTAKCFLCVNVNIVETTMERKKMCTKLFRRPLTRQNILKKKGKYI
jgi:HEPN domain-containing protein